jgi:hypothetical protein
MPLHAPVPGPIHPEGWVRPAGNLDFVETSTLAQHIASGRALGCDFANTSMGAPVLAMDAGTIYAKYVQDAGIIGQADQMGDGALIIRIRHADGSNTGYAHLGSFAPGTAIGATVARGQQIGTVGNSGAPLGAHLHCHYEDTTGVQHEVLALLDQNEADMTITNDRYSAPRSWAAKGGALTGYAYSVAAKTVTLAAGSSAQADAEVSLSPPRAGWLPGPYQSVSSGSLAGYLVPNSQVTLSPLPAPALADCSGAVKTATDPLNVQITTLTADLAAANQKISDAKSALS